MKAKTLSQAKEFTLDKYKATAEMHGWYSQQVYNPSLRDGDTVEKLQENATMYLDKGLVLQQLLEDVFGMSQKELINIWTNIGYQQYESLVRIAEYKANKAA